MPTTDVPAAPATMRAIAAPTWGTADVLEPVMVARPEPGPTEILVAVHAAGINPTDWKARASGGFGRWGDPPILGYDVSGVVEAVGLGASLFQPGDEVFGMPRFPEQAGGYAEYIVAPSRRFAPKPEGLDHVQAAALPLVGLTAWQGAVRGSSGEAGTARAHTCGRRWRRARRCPDRQGARRPRDRHREHAQARAPALARGG